MVEAHVLNLEDTDAVRLWMKGVCEQNIPDLVIANAGRNTDIGPNLEGEDFGEARALVQVNLLSGMALFDATLPFFRPCARPCLGQSPFSWSLKRPRGASERGLSVTLRAYPSPSP